ncbi:MAG: CYTH domain-containing protein [Cyanobium sp.]|jgi:adenylate cyclase
MPLEIERRFLVTGDAWHVHVGWVAELRQGYLQSREDGLTTRIRLQQEGSEEEKAWLTIKAVSDGASVATRHEFEYAIPVADAEALLALSSWRLEKRRHGLLLPGGGEWVLDVFRGANAPLLIAEVELLHADQEVVIPPWCGPEITGLHQLSNASLARQPWQSWDASERLCFQSN